MVMNDHVHVIVIPREHQALESIVQSWKSFTAHRLAPGASGRVWQSEYLDRLIRSDSELRQKIEYVLDNPFRRWPLLSGYRWAWFAGANAW